LPRTLAAEPRRTETIFVERSNLAHLHLYASNAALPPHSAESLWLSVDSLLN
jgi:hypothetical protein